MHIYAIVKATYTYMHKLSACMYIYILIETKLSLFKALCAIIIEIYFLVSLFWSCREAERVHRSNHARDLVPRSIVHLLIRSQVKGNPLVIYVAFARKMPVHLRLMNCA